MRDTVYFTLPEYRKLRYNSEQILTSNDIQKIFKQTSLLEQMDIPRTLFLLNKKRHFPAFCVNRKLQDSGFIL